jgi:hypothetical protein
MSEAFFYLCNGMKATPQPTAREQAGLTLAQARLLSAQRKAPMRFLNGRLTRAAGQGVGCKLLRFIRKVEAKFHEKQRFVR